VLTEIEATPSSAKNTTSLAKPLAISLVALAAGAGAWQSASVVGQQSPLFWEKLFPFLQGFTSEASVPQTCLQHIFCGGSSSVLSPQGLPLLLQHHAEEVPQ